MHLHNHPGKQEKVLDFESCQPDLGTIRAHSIHLGSYRHRIFVKTSLSLVVNLSESGNEGAVNGVSTLLVEVDGLLGTLCDTVTGDLKLGVNLVES